MSWVFADSFDCYAAPADAINGYWDSGPNVTNLTLTAGRFSGSQAIVGGVGANPVVLVKSSGSNDAVHHLVIAFRQTSTITGSSLLFGLQLLDGTTAQCTVSFRTDGAIVLTSGSAAGTVLATYTGAFLTANTWVAFEIEVIINNTTGRFRVRKNGNTSDDFDSGASLDTQNSANAYANKLQIGYVTVATGQNIDDLFWRSDASSVAWMGDIRCYTRMPASDSSVTFSRTSTGVLTQTAGLAQTTTGGNTVAHYTAFTAGYSGTVTGVSVTFGSLGTTVNMKCTIYADNAGVPGTISASSTAPVTPVVAGANVFTFSGVSVVKGTQYWVGVACDGSGLFSTSSATSALGAASTTAYATFPQANPVVTNPSNTVQMSWTYSSTPANWQAVSEAQQDTTTSYVYDSTVNDTDFYTIATIASVPTSVVAVTTRAYMQKSDAGSRTAAVQLKSGATTVASPTITLTTSGWQWAWRTDTTDPNTSSAWVAANVDSSLVGPKVIS